MIEQSRAPGSTAILKKKHHPRGYSNSAWCRSRAIFFADSSRMGERKLHRRHGPSVFDPGLKRRTARGRFAVRGFSICQLLRFKKLQRNQGHHVKALDPRIPTRQTRGLEKSGPREKVPLPRLLRYSNIFSDFFFYKHATAWPNELE